jgi:ATP phosphoribosyltransferase
VEVDKMEIQIAVPNKGRLREPTLRALERDGIVLMDIDERMLYAKTMDPEVRVIFIRAQDIPRFVEEGAADLGITGYDLIMESNANVEELLDLRFGRARIVLASSGKSEINSVSDVKPGMRVATKFSNLARRYFEAKNKPVGIVKISGAAEIMPYLGVADLVVDVTSTGTTLGTHGLQIIDDILESSTRLIANKKSFVEKDAKIREIILAFESVMWAERKKLIMMNVPEKALAMVKQALPAMAGPTLAKVESIEPMWEVYSVVDEREVYKVVNNLKKAGARDILVIPIERIVS